MQFTYQVVIKGLPEALAKDIGNEIANIIQIIQQSEEALDLRRINRIVVTTDFAGELASLSSITMSGNPIEHTEEEYANAIATVLIIPSSKEYEILLIIDACTAFQLISDSLDRYNSRAYRNAFHAFHHELCHVHEANKKLDLFPTQILLHCYDGKDMFLKPLAGLCCSEYIANYLASWTATSDWLDTITGSLADAISRTKHTINEEILSYRSHADIGRIMGQFQRHGGFLVKIAAYTLGYIDGLCVTLPELSSVAAEKLSGSYFEPTWNALHVVLREIRELYPDGWKDLSIYNNLAEVLDGYYDRIGLILSTTEDGGMYAKIPFRTETTPS